MNVGTTDSSKESIVTAAGGKLSFSISFFGFRNCHLIASKWLFFVFTFFQQRDAVRSWCVISDALPKNLVFAVAGSVILKIVYLTLYLHRYRWMETNLAR
jgi:hypothetical protein